MPVVVQLWGSIFMLGLVLLVGGGIKLVSKIGLVAFGVALLTLTLTLTPTLTPTPTPTPTPTLTLTRCGVAHLPWLLRLAAGRAPPVGGGRRLPGRRQQRRQRRQQRQ